MWYGVDPKVDKYHSLSPYNYTLNNPMNVIDPDGRDVILLVDRQGAGGKGHMAMLFQDKKGSWYYFSQGATGEASTESLISASNTEGGIQLVKLEVTETKIVTDNKGNPVVDSDGNPKTEQVTRNITESEALNAAFSGDLGYTYDDSYKINTTKKEDGQIHSGAKEVANNHNSGKSKYNLYFNNCVDACQSAIQENTNINMPVDESPVPNSYFDEVKEDGVKRNTQLDNNPGAFKAGEPKY